MLKTQPIAVTKERRIMLIIPIIKKEKMNEIHPLAHLRGGMKANRSFQGMLKKWMKASQQLTSIRFSFSSIVGPNIRANLN
jgi:hypothetical protein